MKACEIYQPQADAPGCCAECRARSSSEGSDRLWGVNESMRNLSASSRRARVLRGVPCTILERG